MNYKDLIKETAKRSGVPEKTAEAHIKALHEGMYLSAFHNEPMKFAGIMDINLHNSIFAKVMTGQKIGQGDGVNEAIRERAKGKKKTGELIRFTTDAMYLGVVKSHNAEILAFPLIRLTQYTIGAYTRYKWEQCNSGLVVLKEGQYNEKSVSSWLNRNIGKIDPVISVKRMMRLLVRGKEGLGL